ncbi:MAG: hypothetical protein MJ237_01800 [bacterium]|nr:hypothetical protein [bacterium]
MYIVKNLKDYELSNKQRIFAGYIKDNVDSLACYEKITNLSALRKYFAPVNDYEIYTTAIADPALLAKRAIAG